MYFNQLFTSRNIFPASNQLLLRFFLNYYFPFFQNNNFPCSIGGVDTQIIFSIFFI